MKSMRVLTFTSKWQLTVAFVLLLFLPYTGLAQININKIKEKVKEKTTPGNEEQGNAGNQGNQGNNQQDPNPSSEKTVPVVLDPAKPILIGFESLLNEMSLDPISGDFKPGRIKIKNLPFTDSQGSSIAYGTSEGEHRLVAVLQLKESEIGRFAFSCRANYSGAWQEASLMSDDNHPASLKITQGGDYTLQLLVDGQPAHTVEIEIAQLTNKNSVSGLFITRPVELLGKVAFKDQSYGEPNPNSELIFTFFHAALNPEDVFNDELPMSVRLLRDLENGSTELLGGTFNGSIRHRSKWEMTDNIFFERPGQSYNYVKGSDIVSVAGKYHIDVVIGTELYRYDFEVKSGQLVSSDYPGIDDGGACWLRRKPVSRPKYEGFRPTASTVGVKDNISITVTTPDGKTSRGTGAGTPVAFTDGSRLFPIVYLNDATKQKFAYQNVEYITTLKKGEEIIAQYITYNMFGTSDIAYIAPSGDIDMKANFLSPVFMEAMAALPAGAHQLTLVYEIVSASESELIGVQKMTFTSVANNPVYTKNATLLKERLAMSESELADVRFMKYGGEDWAMYENNCGRIVWLRQDEDREYYLYPGDKGRFDRNAGPLEQWNFGTLKWNPIQDFSPYATVYKLTNNELAMMNMKKVPKEVTDKLAPLVDMQLNSQAEYLAKVEALIGKEATEKHKDLLLWHADIDMVKICK